MSKIGLVIVEINRGRRPNYSYYAEPKYKKIDGKWHIHGKDIPFAIHKDENGQSHSYTALISIKNNKLVGLLNVWKFDQLANNFCQALIAKKVKTDYICDIISDTILSPSLHPIYSIDKIHAPNN